MHSKNRKVSASQKRWHDWLRDKGCFCGGAAEIQHIKGAMYALKIDGRKQVVGDWAVIPLCYWHHRDGNNPCNATDFKHRFKDEYGTQAGMLSSYYYQYQREHLAPPFPYEVFGAIVSDVRY